MPSSRPEATMAGMVGTKDVAEHLDGTHKDVLLLRRGLLDLGLVAASTR